MKIRKETQKLLEAYEDVVSEYKENPKDKTGEREGFYDDTVNRAVTLMGYGVLSKQEYQKVKDAMKKIISF